jgi:hypothetical protein
VLWLLDVTNILLPFPLRDIHLVPNFCYFMFNYDLAPLYKETYIDAAADRFNAAVTEAMELVTHFGLRKNNYLPRFSGKILFYIRKKKIFLWTI